MPTPTPTPPPATPTPPPATPTPPPATPTPTAPPTPPPTPTPPPPPWPPPIPFTPPPPPIEVGFFPSSSSRGTGVSFYYSRFKDSSFNFQYKDIYDNEITSDLQLAQNEGFAVYDFSYRASLLSTGAWPSTASSYLVAQDFATNQRSLSFVFSQEKNAELFNTASGERYYSLLFNVKNRGVENSVLATVYHLPANIDSIAVEDYFSSQVSGIVNNVITTWNYTGNGILSGFDITGHVNPFITGYVSETETGFLSTNYRVFVDGFEELFGDYSINGNSDILNFYSPPPSGSLITIQELTGVTELLNSPLSGQINFTVNFDSDSVENYITRGVDVYTGSNTGIEYSLSGFELLKTVSFLENASSQSFSIFSNEVPNNQFVYYRFVPKDDFGTGYVYNSEVSGYLFSPPQQLFYTNAIPPVLSFDQRTGNFFSGFSSPSDAPNTDGALIYQTGSSGQNLYLVKSGQWKTILPYEEITGNIDQSYTRYVSPPLTASSNGRKGDISISGDYLYAATGTNQWGRVQLLSW
jgi:hypothetical protein